MTNLKKINVNTAEVGVVRTADVPVGDPQKKWEPGTVEQYVDNVVATETARAQGAEAALQARSYAKYETYTKTEVNGLVDTPHQNYVTVETYAALTAINPGSADTIYRVCNYDGSTSTVDATKYSEYAWNGTAYVFLCVKSQIDEVFDITVYNNNTKYDTLADALGTNGEHIPSTLRRGGMSVKYVQNSNSKYVQYFLTKSTWSASEGDWEKMNLEDEFKNFQNISPIEVQKNKYINSQGEINADGNFDLYYFDIALSTKLFIFVNTGGGTVCFLDSNSDVLESFTSYPNYRSTWFYKEIPSCAVTLAVSQYHTYDLSNNRFPLRVLMNNQGEQYPSIEDYSIFKQTQEGLNQKAITTDNIDDYNYFWFNSGNLYNIQKLTQEQIEHIILTDGSIIEFDDHFYTDYIPVIKGKKYKISKILSTPGALYDVTKTFVSTISYSTGGIDYVWTAPITGYIRLNVEIALISSFCVSLGETYKTSPNDGITNQEAFINISQIKTFEKSILLGESGNLFDINSVSPGIINDNGVVNPSFSNHHYTDYTLLKAGVTYTISIVLSTPGVIYNLNKVFIQKFPHRGAAVSNKQFTPTFDCYIRLNVPDDNLATYCISQGTQLKTSPTFGKYTCPELVVGDEQIINSAFRNKKMLCVGDSITQSGDWVGLLANYLGMQVYNRGVSGSTLTVRAGITNSMCQRADLPASDAAAYSVGFPTSADLILVLCGANDWGSSGNTIPFGSPDAAIDNTTFCGALHYLMRKLKTKYPAGKIIFLLNYRLYCPELFTQWSEIRYNNPSDETSGFTYRQNSSGKTFDDMRNAIKEIASMYGIETISLLDCGFSFWNTADRNTYSLEQTIDGITAHDGLHPSAAGSQLIAKHLYNEISKIKKLSS